MKTSDQNDAARRAQVLREFGDLLRRRASKARLRKWISSSLLREKMFENVAWGAIRWPKTLGRPAGTALADGFVVDHQWYFEFWHIGLEGDVVEKDGWAKGDPPSVWDGPDQPEHWEVHYLFKASKYNRLEVSFSNTGWAISSPLGLRSFRWLNPKGFEFPSDGGFTALPPITIERQHFVGA